MPRSLPRATRVPHAALRDLRPGPRTRLAGRWIARLLPLLGIAGGLAELSRVHTVRLWPALLGIGMWTLGNYVVSVLRWRSVSGRDLPLHWYVRVFAEGELLGLLTPQHAGALYWRGRQLKRRGADSASTVAELAADRMCCCVSILATLVLGSAALPMRDMVMVLALVAIVVAVALGTRSRWTHRLPTLEPRRAAIWIGYSLLFQAAYVAFVLDAVNAVGASIPPGSVLGLLAAAQIASILPGVHGAGPKEGVLAGGMVALGATHGAAIAAVGLLVSLVWIPALLLGGGGLALRGIGALRAKARLRPTTTLPLLAHPAAA